MAPWVWSKRRARWSQLAEPSGLHLDILQLAGGTQNHGDSNGIDTYPGVSGPRPHIRPRRRCAMTSGRPGPNLRKGPSYAGENCGGLHLEGIEEYGVER